jgi:hypothetical protein
MFQGTIPPEARALARDWLVAANPAEVYVGCSGNFTLERTFAQALPTARLHGNDVTLYSCTLGHYLSGQPFTLRVRDEQAPFHGWLNEYLTEPAACVASVLLLSNAAEFLLKARRNAYFARMAEGYRRQWPALHQTTLEKVKALQTRLVSFHAGDVLDHLQACPPEAAWVWFPPFYCLDPAERILTADLRWVPCGDLREGDGILAFDEDAPEEVRCRRWQMATITRSEPAVAPCVRVFLENGEEVVCTENHPWLATRYRYAPGVGSPRFWVRADELLLKAPYVYRHIDLWKPATSYDAGWLAGIYDGEGSLVLGNAPKLDISQLPGSVADHVVVTLEQFGFATSVSKRPSGVLGIGVAGGFNETLRALGMFRPRRLLAKLPELDFAGRALRSQRETRVKVVAVEPLGMREIQSISTSSRTYIGQGYLMHNSNGYEKMFEALEELLEPSWPKPEYDPLTFERIVAMLGQMQQRQAWFYGTDERNEQLAPYERGVIKASDASVPMWIYADHGRGYVSLHPGKPPSSAPLVKLGPQEPLDGPLGLAKIERDQFEQLRHVYLSAAIKRVASPQWTYAITVGQRVIGATGLQGYTPGKGMKGVQTYDGASCFLLSDFAVGPSIYPRLSKLVLMALLSVEARELYCDLMQRDVRGLVTAVFSDKPVSMKYRGLFDLLSRRPIKEAERERFGSKYVLVYGARPGRWTLHEALAEWQRRYGGATGAADLIATA